MKSAWEGISKQLESALELNEKRRGENKVMDSLVYLIEKNSKKASKNNDSHCMQLMYQASRSIGDAILSHWTGVAAYPKNCTRNDSIIARTSPKAFNRHSNANEPFVSQGFPFKWGTVWEFSTHWIARNGTSACSTERRRAWWRESHLRPSCLDRVLLGTIDIEIKVFAWSGCHWVHIQWDFSRL